MQLLNIIKIMNAEVFLQDQLSDSDELNLNIGWNSHFSIWSFEEFPNSLPDGEILDRLMSAADPTDIRWLNWVKPSVTSINFNQLHTFTVLLKRINWLTILFGSQNAELQ
jgi:hypothetical protein